MELESKDLKGWLQAFVMLRVQMKKTKRPGGLNGYWGLEDFILHQGRIWPVLKGGDVPRGKAGECFRNAMNLALDHQDYIYCEGYATGGLMPVQHAWCLDQEGRVVDPTWHHLPSKPGHKDRGEYIGIAVKQDFVREITLMTEVYSGVIDLPKWDYPIFMAPIQVWKHPVTSKGVPI
jgi:hypothetical protein